MRPAETLGKIEGDGFSLDGAEALSLSSAVDCRIGSLERHPIHLPQGIVVDCRIGSLESIGQNRTDGTGVDCRIGSLENTAEIRKEKLGVDCRIGSLEISLFANHC